MVAQSPLAGPSNAPMIISKMSRNGFECSVQIADMPLEVHHVKRVGDVSIAYIASESGKLFTIVVKDMRLKAARTDYNAKVLIDGGK